MIPIVTDSVAIERLAIYNASVLATNPLNGVRLKNTTGKHLLQGPITVLDKNAYAGDARIDNVPPGQERLLSYGIDLEMTVDNTKNVQTAAVVTARINKGALIIDRKLVSSRDYLADNKGSHDKVILIEHPIRQGWKLVETIKPVETTPSLYRFQGNAPAGKTTLLTIKEESVRQETLAMLPADATQLLAYTRTAEIPQPVRDAIAKAIQMKQAVIDFEAQVENRTSQIDDITKEQERIRENMKTVDAKSQYYERLLAKLNEQESSIEKLQKDRDDLQARSDAQQKALEEYLGGLVVELSLGMLTSKAAWLLAGIVAMAACASPGATGTTTGSLVDSVVVTPATAVVAINGTQTRHGRRATRGRRPGGHRPDDSGGAPPIQRSRRSIRTAARSVFVRAPSRSSRKPQERPAPSSSA